MTAAPHRRHPRRRRIVNRVFEALLAVCLFAALVCFIYNWVALYGFAAAALVLAVARFSNALRTRIVEPAETPPHICHACGYDLRGAAALRCPECGAVRPHPPRSTKRIDA